MTAGGVNGNLSTPEQARELLSMAEELVNEQGQFLSPQCSAVDGIEVDIPELVAKNLPPVDEPDSVIKDTLRASVEYEGNSSGRIGPLRADLGGAAIVGTITFSREVQFVTALSGKLKAKYQIIHHLEKIGERFELERDVTTEEAPSGNMDHEQLLIAAFGLAAKSQKANETEKALGLSVVDLEEAAQIISLLSRLRRETRS